MTNSFPLPRKVIIFAVILPLAAFAGYLLASPTEIDSLAVIGLLLLTLSMPLILRSHHALLVFSWNATITVFFLPGSPYLWMALGGISLGLTILHRILDKQLRLAHVPSVTWSLLLFGLVVAITARMTGGWGLRSLGSGIYGARKYFYIWFAIVAYFALSVQRIPLQKANSYSGMFFLSGVTAVCSNLIYIAGPAAWILYSLFPVDWAMSQAMEDFAGSPFATKFSRGRSVGSGHGCVSLPDRALWSSRGVGLDQAVAVCGSPGDRQPEPFGRLSLRGCLLCIIVRDPILR